MNSILRHTLTFQYISYSHAQFIHSASLEFCQTETGLKLIWVLYIRASESLSLPLMLLGEIILLKDEKHCRQCGWDNQSGGAGECESTEAEARRGQQNKIHIHGYECRLHLHQGIGVINQKGCQRTERDRKVVCVCVCVWHCHWLLCSLLHWNAISWNVRRRDGEQITCHERECVCPPPRPQRQCSSTQISLQRHDRICSVCNLIILTHR